MSHINLLLITFLYIIRIVLTNENNTEYLTEVFFSNLQNDPFIKGKNRTIELQEYVDKKVNNYVELMKESHGKIDKHVVKRSLVTPIDDIKTFSRDQYGTYTLDSFSIEAKEITHGVDTHLFKHCLNKKEQLYMAILEANSTEKFAFQLRISTYPKLKDVTSVSVTNGTRMALITVRDSTFMFVAEYKAISEDFHQKTAIFEFNPKTGLNKIQRIDVEYATDAIFWMSNKNLYLAITSEKTLINGKVSYATKSPIYMLMGKHFDIVNHITTYCPQRLMAFETANFNYLAVANYKNAISENNSYTDIYRYDINDETFELHQELLTNGLVDVKYFCFSKGYEKESFLIISNSARTNESSHSAITTIIYKYVDDYFIPFQGFNIPGVIEWAPILGKYGEFALLVTSLNSSVRTFEYDGWRFVETQVHIAFIHKRGPIHVAQSFIQTEVPHLVLSSLNAGDISIYYVHFVRKSPLTEYQDNMLLWCRKKLEEVKLLNSDDGTNKTVVGEAQTLDQETRNSERRTPVERLDDVDSIESEEMLAVQTKLFEVYTKLSALENYVNFIKSNKYVYEIQEDMLFKNLILKNENFMNIMNANTLNNLDLSEFLNNIIELNNNLQVNIPMHMDKIIAEDEISINLINGVDSTNIVHTPEDLHIKELILEGDAIFDELVVDGSLEGHKITNTNVLLYNGNQTFNSDLISKHLQIDNLINDNIDILPVSTEIKSNKLKNVNIKRLTLNGYLNGINVTVLENFVLKTHGDQEISSEYTFDNLQTYNFQSNVLSEKQIPEELIFINGPDQKIEHDVEFLNDLNTNTLFVKRRLNNINIFDGKLDVLLKDSSEVQFINGYKIIENVELNHLNLRGKIYNNLIKKLIPVQIFDEELVIKDDVNIFGNVTLEKRLTTNNLQSISQNYSVERLEKSGLKLFENIPVHLNFSQQLNIDEVIVDKINNVEVNSWIHNKENEKHLIDGKKIFVNDVHITGPVFLTNLNGLNLTDLNQNILRVNQDQIISAKHHIKDLTVNEVKSATVHLKESLWENALPSNKFYENSETSMINNNVNINFLNVSNVIIHKHLNGFNLNAMLKDTVFIDEVIEITGNKAFANLTILNANVENGINLTKLPKLLNSTYSITGDISFPTKTVIRNINFSTFINEMPKDEFMLKRNVCQIINDEYTFNQITSYKNTFVTTNTLNGVNITDINENSLKIHDTCNFDKVTFENVVSTTSINVTGTIIGFDLENIVTDNNQMIFDKKTFNNNLTVDGYLIFGNLVNGVNISELCSFAFPSQNEIDTKELLINGSVIFAKGLKIQDINNRDIKEILKNAWFLNKDITLYGHLDFPNIYFNDIDVKGVVNNVNLNSLYDTYFSKTRNQTIKALLEFTDGVVFHNIQAKQVVLKSIYDIDLNDFLRTAILNDVDQIFESPLLLDNCNILDLQGQYLLNNLDPINDFMRYSGENIVTGMKIIKNLYVNNLNINTDLKVQNIDLLKWLYGAILNEGNFNVYNPVLLNNSTLFSKGISLQGLLNGFSFTKENILIKSLPQKITSQKNFYGNQNIFKIITLKGLLNNINMDELMNEQTNKYQENQLQLPINFNNKLAATNVNLNGLFNGINVTELVHNLNSFVFINNFIENYARLFDVVTEIRNSLKRQAYYMNYYKETQQFVQYKFMSSIKIDGIDRIVGFKKNQTAGEITFFQWHEIANEFVPDISFPKIKMYENVVNIKSIECSEGNSYLYVESFDNSDNLFNGKFYYADNEHALVEKYSYKGNKTRFLKGLVLPDKYVSCLIAIYYGNEFVHIYCEENDPLNLELLQQLPTRNAKSATSFEINNDLYIIVINTAKEETESCVDIWKFNKETRQFILHDVIYIVGPRSVSVISYHGITYLAIATGYVKNTMYSGLIDIRRFNCDNQKFVTWQGLKIRAPIDVQFSILPSDELLLYVLTKDPTEPLKTYIYEGIFGFIEKIITTTSMKITNIIPFNLNDDKHFVIAQNKDQMICTLIQGVFKGHKYVV